MKALLSATWLLLRTHFARVLVLRRVALYALFAPAIPAGSVALLAP